MPLSASFAILIQTLGSGNNKPEREALTLLLGEAAQRFRYDFAENCETLGESRDRAESHASLIMAIRALWTITPERLFTAADPNYERLAREALQSFGGRTVSDLDVGALSRIFRHLRRSERDGRRQLSGLDLDRPAHQKLLKGQRGRCALCRYTFNDNDINYGDEEDEPLQVPRVPASAEIVLDRYFRRPVLDHIIPHFLGGDGAENWQILCGSCNAGKGEGLAWIMRRGLLPPARPSEALRVSPSLRYALLSSFQASHGAQALGGELRLYRRDPLRLPIIDNLVVVPDP